MPAGPWGGLRTEEDERAQGGVKVSSPQLRQFACEQCGAVLSYAPGHDRAGLQLLRAPQPDRRDAGRDRRVSRSTRPCARPAARRRPAEEIPAKCGSCGADFAFKPPSFAGPCPFCGQPVVVDPGPCRKIRPIGVLPFLIGAQEARRLVGDWLKGLWFAPSGIAEQARGPGPAARRLSALLDLRQPHPHPLCRPARRRLLRDPVCRHRGRRPAGPPGGAGAEDPLAPGVGPGGPRLRRRAGAGRRDPAGPSGRGAGAVGPGRHAPVHRRTISTGFDGELYQLPVDAGLRARPGDHARGDRQRHPRRHRRRPADHRADGGRPRPARPSSTCCCRSGSRRSPSSAGSYRFVVNGRTGEVHGERPWSFWKIAGAVALALMLFLLLALLFSQAEGLQGALRGGRYY